MALNWPRKTPLPDDFLRETFSDLRVSHPGEPTCVLEEKYRQLRANAAAMDAIEATQERCFTSTATDARVIKWLFWAELKKIGIIVKQAVMFTEDEKHANSVAGLGTPGQCVVVSPIGTIILLTSSGRLLTPNSGMTLGRRLSLAFPLSLAQSATMAPPSKKRPWPFR